MCEKCITGHTISHWLRCPGFTKELGRAVKFSGARIDLVRNSIGLFWFGFHDLAYQLAGA